MDYLQRDPKTGRLSFRRAFPAPLRPFIPGSPRELKRSLSSTAVNDDAARIYAKAFEEYDRLLSFARKAAASEFDPLDSPTIAYLAELWRVEALEADDEARWDEEERNLIASLAKTEGVAVSRAICQILRE